MDETILILFLLLCIGLNQFMLLVCSRTEAHQQLLHVLAVVLHLGKHFKVGGYTLFSVYTIIVSPSHPSQYSTDAPYSPARK